ncbi:MFS transporter [Haloparvum sedimenti]|uniref:MFS transporter n=1 Tax=Haloparvum sedimenti TaxID=1678448 RepID=UPI00071E911E|nr:MFS transporter [Haloparvum sedimenti]
MNASDRAVAAFTALGHGTFHGFELSIPLFVPLWIAEFGVSATVVGAVTGASYALIGLLAPLSGAAADRWGSRRLVLLSIGGMGAAFAGLYLASTLVGVTLALLAWGAAASLYHPAGLSLISRGADRRGTVLAVHGAGGNVGMVVGPLAVILALTAAEWRTVAAALAVPAAVAVLVGLRVRIDRDGEGEDADAPDTLRGALGADSRRLFAGGFLLVFAIQMTYGVYYRGAFTFLPDVLAGVSVFEPLTLGGRDLEASRLAYTWLLLVGVAGQYAGGIASDRLSPERTLMGTFAALALVSVAFLPLSNAGVGPLLAVCALLGFFAYAVAPVAQTVVARTVDEASHGLSFGFVYLGTFGVGALGALLAGMSLDIGGSEALFAVLTVVAVLAAALAGALAVRTARAS